MKKLLFILFIFSNSFAQGNLQFNQVINISNTLNVIRDSRVVFNTFTVPIGKVLKIESASVAQVIGSTNPRMNSQFQGVLSVDNNILMHFGQSWGSSMGVGDVSAVNSFPMWLGPGTYNFYFHCYQLDNPNNTNNSNFTASLSALEFNVLTN